MKKILKKVTDLTINELLKKEIILPSLYFKKFSRNSVNCEVTIEDEEFKKEINGIMVKEFENIESFMKNIESNIQTMKQVNKDSKKALIENDMNNLNSITKQIDDLEKEILLLNEKIYKDEIIKTYNRKWLYSKYLDKNAQFKNEGICILINVIDFEYILKEYKELIANNYLIFTANFIEDQLNKLEISYNIVKYFENKFLIFIEKQHEEEMNNLFLNLKKALINTTLKSNSGLMIKGNINYSCLSYNEKQNSQEVFEKLFSQID